MGNILFIHGTGVREPKFSNTFAVIEKKVQEFIPGWRAESCYWGGECGVKFHHNGDSIPSYATARAIGDSVEATDESLVLWQMLYSDPEIEIFSLTTNNEEEEEPNFDRSKTSKHAAKESWLRGVVGFHPSSNLELLIKQSGLEPFWTNAFRQIVEGNLFTQAAINSQVEHNELIAILARAVTAQAIVNDEAEGWPVLEGTIRDALVKRLIQELGGDSRSLLGSAMVLAKRMVTLPFTAGGYLSKQIATNAIEWKRGVISDAIAPFSGDVLLYQTRGSGIRDFIRNRITEITDPVILLAHSLGGIACVDLLVERRPNNVIGLVTVGSQAPLLYEMGCLTTLLPTEQLPENFPPWLNIYDPHDFLSYQGRLVFPNRVQDEKIVSNQPFMQSHSAYWKEPNTWKAIEKFAHKCLKESQQIKPMP